MTPHVCQCGNDADFREDGEPIDDGKHEPDGQRIFCVACYCALEPQRPESFAAMMRDHRV